MNHAVLTDCTKIETLAFTPTLIIGFYEAGEETLFSKQTRHFSEYFPHADIIGCSAESTIHDTLPHVDHFACTYLCLDIKKEAYRLSVIKDIQDQDAVLHPFSPKEGAAAVLFAARYGNLLDGLLHLFSQQDRGHTYLGGIAGAPLGSKTVPSLFYNGRYYREGEILLWHIDEAHYRLEGLSLHDFTPVGSTFEITKVEENTLIEVDYKPALNAVEEMIGPLAQTSIDSFDHPLFVSLPKESKAFHAPLASIKSVDREHSTIELFKTVPPNRTFRISIPFTRKMQEIQLKKFAKFHQKNAVGLLFVCIAYKYHWGDFESLYLMRIAQSLKLPFVGLHTFGEIGPLSLDDIAQVQNQTVTLAVLSERKEKR